MSKKSETPKIDQTALPTYAYKLKRANIESRVLKTLREEHSELYKTIRENVVAQMGGE